MTTITALGNQKGGVGKTTVTLGLAGALALLGRKVLVCDMDPQANATSVLAPEGFDPKESLTMYDLLMADEPGHAVDAITPGAWAGVDLIASTPFMAAFEVQSIMGADTRLPDAFEGAAIDGYDDVLIDLPPSVGRLTLNGLAAADRVLVITSAEAFSVDGLSYFLDTVSQVSRRLTRGRLTVGGVLVNDFNGRLKEHRDRLAEMREGLGEHLIEPLVPRRAAAIDMASYRRPMHKLSGPAARELSEAFVQHARNMSKEK